MHAGRILLLAGTVLGDVATAVPINAVFSGGGSFSFLNTQYASQVIAVQGRGITPHFSGGVDLEFHMLEFLRLGTGVGYERRGGTVDAKYTNQPSTSDDHAFTYNYQYIQFPLYAKAILPLLFPGSIFVGLGPELGVNFAAAGSDHAQRAPPLSDTTTRSNLEEYTPPAEFALSFSLGYEIPVGARLALSVLGGYYVGLTDIYDNPAAKHSIYTRSIRASVGVHLKLAR